MPTACCRVLAIVLTVVAVAPASGQITDEEVRRAIDSGVDYLKSRQNRIDGSWTEIERYPGGVTALCTLALLNSGVPKDDPAIQRALDYLRGFDTPQKTYPTALRTMVFCQADPERDRFLIRRHVEWLESAQIRDGRGLRRAGSWAYSKSLGNGDNSNAQFALLALYEAERVGVSVDPVVWQRAYDHWSSTQRSDGAWGYQLNLGPTGSMTCAGIASMVICAGRAGSASSRVDGNRVFCCGPRTADEQIEDGFRWLGPRFTVRMNPGEDNYLLYYLYGVERIGRLTGRRFIGGRDWYREGAEFLVGTQAIGGQWVGPIGIETDPLIGTSFALLFLSKGRRPVVMAKLKYEGPTWDQHPSGVPHLVRRVEAAWERDLSWQTVDVRSSTHESLLEAPILFLSGSEGRLLLTAAQKTELKDYILAGGFVFAEACQGEGCDGEIFDRDFRALMAELFPESPLRVMPPDHPVWFAERRVVPSPERPLLGIDACCRTSVIYCPANLSCYWELDTVNRDAGYAPEVLERIEECVGIGLNVVAYATNRELKEKLDPPALLASDPLESPLDRGVMVVPKLYHAGGSDDAPRALANLIDYTRQELELRIRTESQLVDATDPALYQFPVLFMHGRRDFRLTPEQRQALAEYLRNGGFLMGDAICASPAFAAAYRREIGALFPDESWTRLPADHPLFSRDYGGFDVSQVQLHDPQLRGDGERLESRRTTIPPLMEVLEVDGRIVAVFSPYDLSCALESSVSLECKGYVRDDALRLGTNLILFALQQ